MDYNKTNITNSTNSTNNNFELLNTYIWSGFLFVIICLNFSNLLYNHINLKTLKKKLNNTLWMKEVYDKLINKYISTDKIEEKKNIIIGRRKNSLKEVSQVFQEADLKDIEIK